MWFGLLVGLSMAAPAAELADFAGTWTLEPPPPRPPPPPPVPGVPMPYVRGDMGSGWGSPLTVSADGTKLTVQYARFAPMDLQGPHVFTFALDGSETVDTVWMGHGPDERRSRARWDGEALVLVTTHRFVDPGTGAVVPVDVTRRLALDGGALVVETTRAGVLGGGATSTRVRYLRP